MNDQARRIFLCPDCGGASTVAPEGDVVCSDCEKRFPLPGQTKKNKPKAKAKTKQQSPASEPTPQQKPAPPEQARVEVSPKAGMIPSKGRGVVQRNVVHKPKKQIAVTNEIERPAEPVLAANDVESVQREHGERRRRMKKQKGPTPRKILFWVLGWVVCVALILVVVALVQSTMSSQTSQSGGMVETLETREEQDFYLEEYPRIEQQFEKATRAQTVGQLAELSLKASQLDRKMTLYYKDHSFSQLGFQAKDEPIFWNVAYGEEPGFVEVVWENLRKEPPFLEGVFVRTEEGWVMDWEHFVRFSSQSWTLFRQQIGSRRGGEFRVYAKKIKVGEGSNFKPWIKVQLYPPYRKESRREQEASEVILLDENNPLATKMIQVFADKSGRSEGYSELWARDSVKLRRVNLSLEWAEDPQSGEQKMVIKEILAEHWRSLAPDEIQESIAVENGNE